jgi:hypothetical protein
MSNEFQVELRLESADQQLLDRLEQDLPDVETTRGEAGREPITVLTILVTATATVKLTTALLELQEKWRQRKEAARVAVSNEAGREVDLATATEQDFKDLIEADQQ